MTIIPTLVQFLGYDDPGPFVPQAQAVAGSTIGTPLTATLPLPKFRVRQVLTSAIVWDGQTVMLGGLIAEDVSKQKDKVPILGISHSWAACSVASPSAGKRTSSFS
jgi:Flp pilus assembly secretin CpaC